MAMPNSNATQGDNKTAAVRTNAALVRSRRPRGGASSPSGHADRTMKAVPGAGGVSPAMSELEGGYSMNWARNIWADTLG